MVDRSAETFNLSLGGIGVRLTEPIEDDDMVQVRFCLPDCATSIRARGEIAWPDPEGNTGIKFLGMNSESHAHLAHWLERAALRISANPGEECLTLPDVLS